MTAELIHAPLHCDIGEPNRGTFAVIGNLDGVHLGHQALVKETVARAVSEGKRPAAIVFDPHPRRVFRPETPPFQLTDIETKRALLSALGIEVVFALPFVEDLYSQSPETFVQVTLHQRLGVAGIVTGTDFQFGAGRSGNADALSHLANEVGMAAHSIAPVLADAETKYSSSSVRDALREGRPDDAAAMLGRPWSIRGTVIQVLRLARTLDFPTANISLGDYVRPMFGVYAVTAHFDDQAVRGIANIGVRPTVDGSVEMLEVHLFDFDADIYGTDVSVDVHEFIRLERKFSGLDELKAQIAKDCEAARRWHQIANK